MQRSATLVLGIMVFEEIGVRDFRAMTGDLGDRESVEAKKRGVKEESG